jgi:hypothetical protein
LQDNVKMMTASFPFANVFTSKAIARALTVALLVGLAALLAHFYLKIQFGAPAPSALPSVSSVVPSTPSWMLGASASAAVPVSDYKLLGVVAQGGSGYALIQNQTTPNKRALVLKVGQSLPDGSRLLQVSPKAIVLVLDGVEKTLPLDVTGGKGAAANSGINAAPIAISAAPNDAVAMAQIQQMQQQQAQLAQQAQAQIPVPTAPTESGDTPGLSTTELSIPPSMRRRLASRLGQ